MERKKVATIAVEIEVVDDSQGWYDFEPNDDGSDGYWPSRITDYVRDSINESSAVINAEVSFQVTSIRWLPADGTPDDG